MGAPRGIATRSEPRPSALGHLMARIALLATLHASASALAQEEVRAFGLTDVGGRVRVEYQSSEQDWGANGFEARDTWEEEFWFDSQSFVYHPILLEMDLGGGPLLVQQQVDTPQGGASVHEVLWGWDAQLRFLKLKPYAFTLFNRRQHPSVSTGLAGRYLTEFSEYGASGFIREELVPLVPAELEWEVSSNARNGSGFGTQIDETVDRALLRGVARYREKDRLRFHYSAEDRVSSSGSQGLPISETSLDTSTLYVLAENTFLAQDALILTQNLNVIDQVRSGQSPTDSLRYDGTARWRPWQETLLTGNLSHNTEERADFGTTRANAFGLSVSGNLGPEREWGYLARGRASRVSQPEFERSQDDGQAELSYLRYFRFGHVSLSGSLLAANTDQQSAEEFVSVFDEAVTLSGTLPVDLANPFVDLGSVVVTNVTGSQTFVEGLDYRLITIGSVTSLERLVDGNIQDGQTVLVSYRYFSEGTLEYDSRGTRLGITATLFDHLQFFLRHDRIEHELLSGSPNTPLNDRSVSELGVSVTSLPVRTMTLGGEARVRDQQEDLTPYTSQKVSAFLQIPITWGAQVRVDVNRLWQDNIGSEEDVDLLGYNIGVGIPLRGFGTLDYQASVSTNDGGSVPRDYWRQSLRYNWTYRQMRVTASLAHYEETMGTTRRQSTQISAQLTRVF